MFMERLRLLRKEAGLSQQMMADALGISRQAYSNYEAGNREPSYETALQLADYFNVTTDYLLGRVEKPGESADDEDSDIKVALFGGDGEVTDKMWEDVMQFVEFVKAKQREERNGKS